MSWVIFFGVLVLHNPLLAENNLNQVQALWTVPEISRGVPAPGKRVLLQLEDSQGADDLYHVLYLPTDWRPDASWPLVVEYPGNGGYANELGDSSDGTMEGCMMGWLVRRSWLPLAVSADRGSGSKTCDSMVGRYR